MQDYTISSESAVGQRLDKIKDNDTISYLTFKNSKVDVTIGKITIGRDPSNNVVVDSKLASRNHAVIQKIKNAYYLKDCDSTNGTFLNGTRIPADKYIRIQPGDKITIGNDNVVMF